MADIQVLDEQTIDKIAAGEVVERPSSVVKELVENAMDAKATAITIEIKDGGISLIRITDNGQGIPKAQVPTAFLRHATSKLKCIEDLLTISSLGFRGEALSSIAAVSQVELITKTSDELTGTKYVIEGSKEKSTEDIGAPEGTTFLVRNLFYNTPARQKFLKSTQTEASYISTLVERLALSHPDISFQFIANNQSRIHTNGNSQVKDIIYHIYGRDIAAGVLPIHDSNELFTINGYIGKPFISRGNRNFETYFINGRYIKSALLTKCIEDAYKPYLMKHQYPFTVLQITMDSRLIDVNVHPAKMEIRFSQREEIYRMLTAAIRKALEHKDIIPQVPPKEEKKSKTNKEAVPRSPEPFEKKRLEAIAASMKKDSPYERKYDYTKDFTELKLGQNPQELDSAEDIDKIKKDRIQADQSGQNPQELGNAEDIDKIKKDRIQADQSEQNLQELDNIENYQSNKSEQNPRELDNTADFDKIKENRIKSDLQSAPYIEEQMQPAQQNSQQQELQPAQQNSQQELCENTKDHHAQPQNVQQNLQLPPNEYQELHHSEQEVSYLNDDSRNKNVYEQLSIAEGSSYHADFMKEAKRRNYTIIGQLFDTYWLVQVDNELFIIDQHAAHEKVLYEKMMAQLSEHEFTSQQISPPVIITMTMQEQELFQKYQEQFLRIGFEVDSFGGNEYSICAVPANLYSLNQKELFLDLLDGLTHDTGKRTPELILEKIASMSCKAAVKGSQRLSRGEVEQLLTDLLELENPYNCPHGRPTIISMTKSEIERKFKRIV